jgi:hypothetical protein
MVRRAWSWFRGDKRITIDPMKTILLLLFMAVSATTFAQSSARFAITRSVVAGGGTTFSTSSRFQLASTIAQPLAAVPSSARFSIQGGFWIVPAPILFGPTTVGTNFQVSIQSELGKTYTLQYMNSLGSGWQSMTPIAGTGGIITVTNGSAGNRERFYRLLQQ